MAEHKNATRAPLQPLDARDARAPPRSASASCAPRPARGARSPPPRSSGPPLVSGTPAPTITGLVVGLLAVSCAACVAFGRYAETRFGRKDAPEVVIDETAGQCVALLAWPGAFVASCAVDPSAFELGPVLRATAAVGAAFVLFRVMDILKPWPARSLERLPHGWGVLLDDLMAGLYAAIGVQLLLRLGALDVL